MGYPASPARHRRLEAEWGVKCYEIYGMSEIGLLAGECSSGDGGQHFYADYILAEVVDPVSHQNLPTGDVGVGVYTSLWKKGSPLLRYWSDDYISLKHETCSCGSDFPKLFFKGRGVNSIVLNGKRLFVSDFEDILLSDDRVGDEFLVEVSQKKDGRDECLLKVECRSLDSICRNIQAKIEEFSQIRTTVKFFSTSIRGSIEPQTGAFHR